MSQQTAALSQIKRRQDIWEKNIEKFVTPIDNIKTYDYGSRIDYYGWSILENQLDIKMNFKYKDLKQEITHNKISRLT